MRNSVISSAFRSISARATLRSISPFLIEVGVALLCRVHQLAQVIQFVPDAVCAEPTPALKLQQILGVAPALVFLADTVLDRDAHVLEEHLVDFVVTGHGDDRFHAYPWRAHIDEQKTDAMLGSATIVRAHQAENVIGEVGVGRPDLGAVDDVVITSGFGLEFQAGQVGAGPGLRVPLAPVVLTVEDFGQVFRLLFRCRRP